MITGRRIYHLIEELWPINRSLTGDGNRLTLKKLKKINSKIKIFEVLSGTKAFDWKIPLEWNVKKAFLQDFQTKKKIVDFKDNNLHLMGYSISVNKIISFKDLKKKLNYIKSLPEAIPYTTSYYKRDWSFNISYNKFKKLNKKNSYLVNIDTQFKKGSMSYGEILIKGQSKKEFLISTYICHPSMANNELSGPSLSIYLSKWLNNLKNRKFSYRFIFIPETIGSIYYISKNLKKIKKNVKAIFNITCVGDNKNTSILFSKYGNTIADKILLRVLKKNRVKYKKYNWLKRGSDERQFMSVGVDIPTVSLMSSKYREYPEYHTSDDNLNFISRNGLLKNFNLYKKLILEIEKIEFPVARYLCEPNLSKRDLYSDHKLSKKNKLIKKYAKNLLNFLSYSDGQNSLEDISKYIKFDLDDTKKIRKILKKENLI